MINLCAPALIYVAFSLTQIVIDTFNGLYNTALLKAIVMIIITLLLNMLCQSGMGIISWIIVFIPFIFMSIIVAILLYVFGLDPSSGTLNITCDKCTNTNSKSGNLIYSSTTVKPKLDKYVDVGYSESPLEMNDNINVVDIYGSSDPQYE